MPLRNTSFKGNSFDVQVARQLEGEGYTVGSRRHIKGPGDLLAWREGEPARLIECKRGSGSPYANFRRADRAELREYARAHGLVAELAWRKDRGKLEYIPDGAWPAV